MHSLLFAVVFFLGVGISKQNFTDGTCTEGQFRCADGTCIAGVLKCNGEPDCPDGGDEDQCGGIGIFQGPWAMALGPHPEYFPVHDIAGYDSSGANIYPFVIGEEEQWPDVTVCAEGQYRCVDGKCIAGVLKCNGEPDCDYGEDEEQCTGRDKCAHWEFQCSPNGTCIPAWFVCDDDDDCPGGEDESPARCPGPLPVFPVPGPYPASPRPDRCDVGLFQCPDGPCIPGYTVCNAVVDCPGGEDESPAKCRESWKTYHGKIDQNMFRKMELLPCSLAGMREAEDWSGSTCTEGEFRCADGKCLPGRLECDGIIDCLDESDEKQCAATTLAPPVKLCPPVAASASVRSLICHVDGKEVNCSLPMHRGTVAVSTCASGGLNL